MILNLAIIIVIIIVCILNIRKNRKIVSDLLKNNYDLKSKVRSLETIYGNAVENLIPYMEEFKNLDPKNFRQMGKPLDYVYFGEDEIIFFEVKSGNSKLNNTQRRLKSLIENGKVSFKEVRIKR